MKNIKRFRKPLVLLSLALVLALVWTTGASTYAKYITEKKIDSLSATVAKWGFVISAETKDLFGKEYEFVSGNDFSTVVGSPATSGATINVKASSENSNVVAPGTKGSMTFTIGGSAEVLSQLTVSFTNVQDISLTKDNSTYYPIVWTLKVGNNEIETYSTLQNLVARINAYTLNGTLGTESKIIKLNNGVGIIQPNTTIDETIFTISWEWAFKTYDGDKRLPDGFNNVDEADTYLGNYAAWLAEGQSSTSSIKLPDGYSANTTVSFDLTIKIEQIQKEA